ncbi:ABC transporter permease [Methanothrix sp.]|uniref:ABC transporter permease n=1 Tax=Methanothrix sp. TaxID=90426 RepID=UPI003BB57A10
MASNQTDINRLGKRDLAELAGRGQESISILSRVREVALKAGLALLLIIAMTFIALPVVALFLRSPLDTTLRSLHDPVVIDALRLSLMTSTVTTITVVFMGTPIAYVSARFRYFGKELADSLIDLPVIMPPAVAGIALLMAFGRMGILGRYLDAFGVSIAFTTLAVIIAQVFVSSPFYIRQARTSFEDVDIALENAARTLGGSRVYAFFHVILPIAINGLISGAIMAFARSLGEFGATIMFAGNFQGRTQTMPLAIYTAMQGDLDVSLCIAIILVAISFVVIFLVKTLTRRVYKNAGN